jgi:hypothetical protein
MESYRLLFYFQCIVSLFGLIAGTALIFLNDDVKFFVGIVLIVSIIVYWLPNPKIPKSDRQIHSETQAREIGRTVVAALESYGRGQYDNYLYQSYQNDPENGIDHPVSEPSDIQDPSNGQDVSGRHPRDSNVVITVNPLHGRKISQVSSDSEDDDQTTNDQTTNDQTTKSNDKIK